MESTRDLAEIEREWQVRIESKAANKTCAAPIVVVCGPSGAGKTTVVRQLADKYPVYVETTVGNPYLQALLEGTDDFDATANQQWFLDRIGEHISQASPHRSLVLDQDPAAIVLVYSRMFFDAGSITERQYHSLLQRLMEVEDSLTRWTSPRAVLCLDAPAEVLHERVLRRSTDAKIPPVEWFTNVRNGFQRLFARLPNATVISTVELTPGEITSRAQHILERI